jgi:hypothetical protein
MVLNMRTICLLLPKVFGLICLMGVSVGVRSEIIFEESFDTQPDFTSSMEVNLEGWSHHNNSSVEWSPSSGFPEKHDAFEVLASNTDKARGGRGKSYVAWRESYDPGWSRYNTDGILMKVIPEKHETLYVSFYLKLSEQWTSAGSSKFFRVYSWDESSGTPFKFFSDGSAGPMFGWNYAHSAYGVRNFLSFRGGPHGENYKFTADDILGSPREPGGLGDISLNFTGNTVGMAEDGGTPRIRDQVGGGYISDNLNQTATTEQIFGDKKVWVKMAFYVQMNSAPGVADGHVRQWINDELIFSNDNVRWVGQTVDNKMVGWNAVAIGGNDFFQFYANDKRYEEWYAIDDIVIRTDIPVGKKAPNPPSNISIN